MNMRNWLIVGIIVALVAGLLIGYFIPRTPVEVEKEVIVEREVPVFTKEVKVSQAEGLDVRWVLPGPRSLDQEIFGTPANPLGFEDDIGLPLQARLTNEAGTAYTATAMPTPFSDNFKVITGSFDSSVKDVTPLDSPQSKDSVQAEFQFTDPTGQNRYRVVLKMVIPVGPFHPFFGGVLVDGYHHGKTGVGTRLMPTVYTYAAFWGVGALYINDELVSGNRIVHVMTTENVRSVDYKLLTDKELPHKGIHTHLILPNTVATPEGPMEEPVPTRFTLPNDMEQPFIHIMYEDVNIEGLEVL